MAIGGILKDLLQSNTVKSKLHTLGKTLSNNFVEASKLKSQRLPKDIMNLKYNYMDGVPTKQVLQGLSTDFRDLIKKKIGEL